MKPDEFEQQLQNQPLRPVPSAWRAGILRKANAAGATDLKRMRDSTWWREWLWPCPQAWAGLVAAWMILLGLHVADAPRSSLIARTVPPTPEARMALAAQRREMTRLLDGPVEPPSPPRSAVPGPRSERLSPSKA